MSSRTRTTAQSDFADAPSGNGSKELRSRTSTRRLLDASAALIAERGYERTTLVAIGERAGYSYALITRRFGSKEGLLKALLESIVSDWGERQLRPAIGESTGADALQAWLHVLRTSVDRSPTTMRAFYSLMFEALVVPALREDIAELHRDHCRYLGDLVRAGVSAGTARSDLVPENVGDVLAGAVLGAAYHWLLGLREMTAALVDLGRLIEEMVRPPAQAANKRGQSSISKKPGTQEPKHSGARIRRG